MITGTGTAGILQANFSIGPTQPVCNANATVGPAPSQYSSNEAVITSQSSGAVVNAHIPWLSTGCEVYGTVHVSLAPGLYSLDLSNCQYMGCKSSLPKTFVITANQTTDVVVSIDTGIR